MRAFSHHRPFLRATLRAFYPNHRRVHEHSVRLRRHLAERLFEFVPARETFQLEPDVLIWFWMAVIFSSIAWYGFLVFFIGWKGGRELGDMIQTFKKREDQHDE